MSSQLPSVSDLELAALAAAAMKDVQIRGYQPPMITSDNGQSLVLNDTQGGRWLAWAPATSFTNSRFAQHANLLRLLSDAYGNREIPFSVELPTGVTTRAGDGIVIVYPHGGGTPITETSLRSATLLPTSLGTALGALHELPAGPYASITRARATADQTRSAYTAMIEKHATAIPSRLRTRWLDALKDDALWGFEPVPLHGNLSTNCVYASPEGAVLSIHYFTNAAVGDPAQDIAWLLFHAEDEFLEVFQRAYSARRSVADLHVLTRAQLISELETLRWYVKGQAAGDRNWSKAGLQALRDMDAEIGNHWLVAPKPDVVEISFTVDEEPLLRLRDQPEGDSEDELPVEDPLDSGATEVIHPV